MLGAAGRGRIVTSRPCYAANTMRPIEAHYENGVLRRSAPLALRPGERVGVVVMRRPDPNRWDMDRLEALADQDDELADDGLADWADALDREDRG